MFPSMNKLQRTSTYYVSKYAYVSKYVRLCFIVCTNYREHNKEYAVAADLFAIMFQSML